MAMFRGPLAAPERQKRHGSGTGSSDCAPPPTSFPDRLFTHVKLTRPARGGRSRGCVPPGNQCQLRIPYDASIGPRPVLEDGHGHAHRHVRSPRG